MAEEAEEEDEAEYHSRDFAWEDLRNEIESDASLSHHLLSSSLPSSSIGSSSTSSSIDADAWRSFHHRHSTGRFFKERRYLLKEFPELVSCCDSVKVLEVGCGNGSTVLPILRAGRNTVVYGCDCSEDVLERAKEIVSAAKGIHIEDRFHPFLLDFSVHSFPEWLFCSSCQCSLGGKCVDVSLDGHREKPSKSNAPFMGEDQCCIGGVDFVTLIFTLSAVPFDKMPLIIERCVSALKPGGLILFRDYGLYDMTMLRFSPDQRVGSREYMRSDGTLSYFFSLDVARDLFCAAGLVTLELEYCCIRSVNRRNGKTMRRVWVHGKFQKPMPNPSYS
ncbi:Methyltransferase-like protein 6 [Ananas comosus]|uniref:tRNA N(3)-methylcytidine methyltransferase n=1 Tax=Ananas comosus TaxID=4615 RepID=A0A199VS11_ANACO|nr:Methyltransferase-like protein 6 [Ananas comosus]